MKPRQTVNINSHTLGLSSPKTSSMLKGEPRSSIKKVTARILFFLLLSFLAGPLFPTNSSGQLFQVDDRLEFLQKNFAKFVPVQFQKGTNSLAAIRRVNFRENSFEYGGRYYAGISFTTPSWLDGNLAWLCLVAKTKEQSGFDASSLEWYIVPETGKSHGFTDFLVKELTRYPVLQGQFPYTRSVMIQHCELDYLVPDKTYAIWFSFKEKDSPDLAFSLTIRSPRGETEFGKLPLR